MDLEAEKRAHDEFIQKQDRAIAIKAALERLEREGDRRPDIELDGWEFVT